MIHVISKTHSLSITEASKYNELDYWKMTAFENLECAKEEYLVRKFKNE